MPASTNQSNELAGWKVIANYLQVSVRTAQNFEKEYGLPVRRKFGIKAPVYAFVSEVDEWVEVHRTASDSSLSARPEHLSTGDLDQPSKLPAPRKSRIVAATVLAIALLAIGLTYVALRPNGPPTGLFVQDKHLVAKNASGREIWRFEFPSRVEALFYQDRFMERRTWIGELGNAGKTSVLALFHPADFQQKTHRLYCLSESGRLLWNFVPGRTVIDERGFTMAPPYYVRQICVLKGRKQEDTRIAVASVNYAGQAGQIAFLDALGRVRGEYWHPGHLAYMTQCDIDGDGRNELLLGGANNAEHAATLVALDPLQISGLSTPHPVLDPSFRISNMPEAHEKAVVLFARGCVGKSDPYTRARELWVTPSRIVVAIVDSFTESSTANITYEFDHRLNLQGIIPMPEYALKHREMEQAHQLNHPYDQKREMEDLRKRLVIRWGFGHAAGTEAGPQGSSGTVQQRSDR